MQSTALTNYDMYGYKYEAIQNGVLMQADGWAASGHKWWLEYMTQRKYDAG